MVQIPAKLMHFQRQTLGMQSWILAQIIAIYVISWMELDFLARMDFKRKLVIPCVHNILVGIVPAIKKIYLVIRIAMQYYVPLI